MLGENGFPDLWTEYLWSFCYLLGKKCYLNSFDAGVALTQYFV
jgi:hypothetical protein